MLVLDIFQSNKYEDIIFGIFIEPSLMLRIKDRDRFCFPVSYFNRQDQTPLRWKLGFLLSQDEWVNISQHGFVWH